ncbi:Programmed cell death toxin MazF [Francisella cf. novicida Fx1]|uniref:PemK family transcriptional regulator n=1 Tax=Francisella hispaniensis FSC454 TaxID=1088883 RepID=A0AAC9J6X6_9GAMM|nr:MULTISPECIES: type II toxin-antitoxin system PemK/MazF family toxin [Francisella]AEB27595.1 Programmed cell death toxin MazF [Francisella cf. novicida Fx1]APD50166.1 PemK family transcriptional regulator [Francisella hispaniensis FSC454]KYW82804.1 PemK family transcriptional regulator [Francisella hispaniensis FSC454]
MKYIPELGDIVWLDFDPSAGTEIMKRRPALVLSRQIFNEHTGFVMVAPITSTDRNNEFTIKLPNKYKTKGSILCYQARTLDYNVRKIAKIESLSAEYTSKAVNIVKIMLS